MFLGEFKQLTAPRVSGTQRHLRCHEAEDKHSVFPCSLNNEFFLSNLNKGRSYWEEALKGSFMELGKKDNGKVSHDGGTW